MIALSNNVDLANKFADFYQDTCTTNNTAVSDRLKNECFELFDKYEYKFDLSPESYLNTVEELDSVICALSKGKGGGPDDLVAEHIIHSFITNISPRKLIYTANAQM